MDKTQRFGLLLLSCGTLMLLIIMLIISRLGALIPQLVVANSGDIVTRLVNEAVNEIIERENIGYDDLVSLRKNGEGDITALVTNMAQINRLHSDITNLVIDKLTDSDVDTVSVPLGNLIGGVFLSGHGPDISVKVLSLSSVNTDFRNNFSSAGINQTQHRIMLDIDVVLDMLLPTDMESITIDNSIVIAETVIVGEVPNAYIESDVTNK